MHPHPITQIHYFYFYDSISLYIIVCQTLEPFIKHTANFTRNEYLTMHFNDLRTFIAVADCHSFSHAAQRLSITQPAVTKRIQALERRFAVNLFDRVGKRVLLTQAGQTLLPQAQRLLTVLTDAEKQLQNLSTEVGGTLRMATSHHIGLHRLAPVLQHFRVTHPQVQVNISFEDSEVAHELLRQGEIELAVVTLNPAGDNALLYQPIWHDPLVFVGTQTQQRNWTLEALAALPSILPGSNTFTGRIVMQRFADQGVILNPGMSTNYLETIGMLVSVGLGWSVLPRSMLSGLPALQELDVQCPSIARTLGCVTHPARTPSNAANAFLQAVSAYADVVPS